MKKFILTISLILSVFTINAQTVASRKDSLAWDIPVSTDVSTLTGYDVAFTLSTVTATNLGSGTVISNAIQTFRVTGGSTVIAPLSNTIPLTTVAGIYNLHVRSVGTNGLVSSFVTLPINFIVPPNPPRNPVIVKLP